MTLAKSEPAFVKVRVTPKVMKLLQNAAASSRKDVAEYLLEAGVNAAEGKVIGQWMFKLDDAQWQAFQENIVERLLEADVDIAKGAQVFKLDDAQWRAFQEILERPVTSKPRLAKLLAEKSVLE